MFSLRGLCCALSLLAAWGQQADALRPDKAGNTPRTPYGTQRYGPWSKRTKSAFNTTTYSCASTAPSVTASKPNVWAPLTETESASVVKWLFEQKDLNLTSYANASAWDNTM
jgi:primary-amine oxidase